MFKSKVKNIDHLQIDLAVDWLELYGGAERVVSAMSEITPFKNVYTLTDLREKKFRKLFFQNEPNIKSTFLQHFGSNFKVLLPIFPFLFERLKVDIDTDLIISSSFNVAKGIQKSKDSQKHICYIQNENFRYINSTENLKLFFGKSRIFIKPLIPYLQNWDIKSSKNPDLLIANSKYTQKLIRKKYQRDSKIIYPPVDIDKFEFSPDKLNYFVAIGRIAQAKRFDVLIEAFNRMPNQKLVIIGDGPLRPAIQKLAYDNIQFTGYLDTKEINTYLQKAKASISLGIESFGIAAVESQACGTPVIALNFGGTAETIIDKVTGLHLRNAKPESIIKAVHDMDKIKFDYAQIRANALQYDQNTFKANFYQLIADLV